MPPARASPCSGSWAIASSKPLALTFLGDIRTLGRAGSEAARPAWQQALAIFDDLKHPDAEGVRSRLGPNPGGNDSDPAAAPHCAECAPMGSGPMPVPDR